MLYAILYASGGSVFHFLLVDWIDSPGTEYYNAAYTSRFGLQPTTFSILPAVVIFVALLVVLSRKNKSALAKAILSACVILGSQVLGWLGFSFVKWGPPFVSVVIHMIIAAIVGLSVGEHFSVSATLNDARNLKEDYREHLEIFGHLFRNLTLIAMSGVLGVVFVFASQPSLPFAPNPLHWQLGVTLYFIYVTFGIFCVFLLRYYWSIMLLKKAMRSSMPAGR